MIVCKASEQRPRHPISAHPRHSGCQVDKMEDIASLSTEQSNTLEANCELLKQQFSAKSQDTSGETVPAETTETSEDVDMDTNALASSSGYDVLQYSFSRLRHLAQEKQKTVFFAEADTIIQDLEQKFFPTLNAERDERSDKNDKGKRRRDSTESDSNGDELEYQHEIKRIKGLLTASHCVAVNDKGFSHMLHEPELLPLLILILS